MTRQEFNEKLEYAGNCIAKERCNFICGVIGTTWQYHPIGRIFNPGSLFWWGRDTMSVPWMSDEAREARLLGIAFMITIPEDMI